MNWWRRLAGRKDLDQQLDSEFRDHLERLTRDYVRAGLGEEEARRRARLEFGGVEQIKEECRDVRGLNPAVDLARDLRYAMKGLRRNPGFAVATVLTIAIGIGANTAVYSVVHAVLLRPLPYKDADRFVQLAEELPAGPDSAPGIRLVGINRTELDELRARATMLSHLGTYAPLNVSLNRPSDAVRLSGIRVSPHVFTMLGHPPLIGRLFEPREEASGLARVVILGYDSWQRYLAGDRDIVGKVLSLDGIDYSVIGVMPRGFRFPDQDAQFWMPFAWPSEARMVLTGRLRDGASLAAANVEVNGALKWLRMDDCTRALALGLKAPPPPPLPPGMRGGRLMESPCAASSRSDGRAGTQASAPRARFRLIGLQERVVAPVRPALLILMAAVGLVLLIASVNVANLMLVRGAARQREMSIRAALGAGRSRLLRQLFTESLALALMGGAVGVGVAHAGVRLLRTFGAALPRHDLRLSYTLPRLDEVGIDGNVLIFALALSVVSGVLFALIPAIRQSDADRTEFLRDSSGSARSGFDLFRRHRLRGLLVVAETAMAMLLVIAAGLMIRSFINLSNVRPGYEVANVLTFQVALPPGLPVMTFHDDLAARLTSIPGVQAVGYADTLPLSMARGVVSLRTTPAAPLAGPPPPPPGPNGLNPPEFPDLRIVSRGFLKAMGTHVIEGRGFEDITPTDVRVALINRTLSRSGLLGPNPIGRSIYGVGTAPTQIAGIVEDVRQFGIDVDPGPQLFVEYSRLPAAVTLAATSPPYFAVRSDADPRLLIPAIRGLVQQVEPRATLDNVATLDQLVSNSITRPRLYAGLLGIFAAAAVALAAVGIYGVIAFSIVQRTREIGVRIALGARGTQVLGMVLQQVLGLTVVGIAAGIVSAAVATRYLKGMLYGLAPLDPATFGAMAVLFALIAVVAAVIPARRAIRVDPMVALRAE